MKNIFSVSKYRKTTSCQDEEYKILIGDWLERLGAETRGERGSKKKY